jgi:geranylgeranylglycerol-phosphate geranylgeranyltransferase
MTPQKSLSKAVRACIRLVRPVNFVMMGIAVIVGEVAILGGIPSIRQMFYGFIVSSFLTASSMVINDVVDLEIDRINAPYRPLPSGMISTRSALIFAALLTILGILAAVPLSLYTFIIAILTFIVSLTYNLYGKKIGLPGNMMVAYCVAVPFLFGGVAVAGSIDLTVAVFFLLAFLATVGREVTKGIADMEGDRLKGIRTAALSYGPKVAALISALFYIAAVLITPLPYIFGYLGIYYSLVVLVVDVGFFYSSFYIVKYHSKESALKVKKQALLWMLLALVAFFLGGITR